MLKTYALKGKAGPAADAVRINRFRPEVLCLLVVFDVLEIEDGVVVD